MGRLGRDFVWCYKQVVRSTEIHMTAHADIVTPAAIWDFILYG